MGVEPAFVQASSSHLCGVVSQLLLSVKGIVQIPPSFQLLAHVAVHVAAVFVTSIQVPSSGACHLLPVCRQSVLEVANTKPWHRSGDHVNPWHTHVLRSVIGATPPCLFLHFASTQSALIHFAFDAPVSPSQMPGTHFPLAALQLVSLAPVLPSAFVGVASLEVVRRGPFALGVSHIPTALEP